MKYLKILLISLILVFSGCATVQPDVTNTVYIKKQLPVPLKKPKFEKYNVIILNINGIDYYALQKADALKLILNWVSYKKWAEGNYKLLIPKTKKDK